MLVYLCISTRLMYLELFLQTVHLCPQGVDNVLPMLQHKGLQLLRSFHLLNVLQPENKKQKTKQNTPLTFCYTKDTLVH